ncbi:hypothetical protein CAPN002_08040 [Capnocytophaga stomatis]|uniref:Uncharacterized protein n=2 Tax=Capnocytophaga stomatis TaxID=1848904 RepID=A0A250FWB8_9FLAO|nr:hypothetical protein CGC58_06275 [Capnocytophaga stomatis]GIJ93586.1 hypothetical protein CAPN002_08040 [Capnocytophaga stomatis]
MKEKKIERINKLVRMKKAIFTLTILFSVLEGFAQFSNIENTIKDEIVGKIKGYNPINLVPYSLNGKDWGLMDVVSKEKITKPIMESPNTFQPHLEFSLKNHKVIIYKDYTFSVEKAKKKNNPTRILSETYTSRDILPVSVKQHISMDSLGFKVELSGGALAIITEYSKKYKRHQRDEDNIDMIPIPHGNLYYTVLHQENKDVVIDQNGKELEGFSFKRAKNKTFFHQKVKFWELEHPETFLYVEDFDNKKGLITLSGQKVLFGELLSEPFYDDVLFQYHVQSDKELSGIVDFSTRGWVVAPQRKYRIHSILHTSSREVFGKGLDSVDYRNKDFVNIYFLVSEGNKYFVLDTNANPIKFEK